MKDSKAGQRLGRKFPPSSGTAAANATRFSFLENRRMKTFSRKNKNVFPANCSQPNQQTDSSNQKIVLAPNSQRIRTVSIRKIPMHFFLAGPASQLAIGPMIIFTKNMMAQKLFCRFAANLATVEKNPAKILGRGPSGSILFNRPLPVKVEKELSKNFNEFRSSTQPKY